MIFHDCIWLTCRNFQVHVKGIQSMFRVRTIASYVSTLWGGTERHHRCHLHVSFPLLPHDKCGPAVGAQCVSENILWLSSGNCPPCLVSWGPSFPNHEAWYKNHKKSKWSLTGKEPFLFVRDAHPDVLRPISLRLALARGFIVRDSLPPAHAARGTRFAVAVPHTGREGVRPGPPFLLVSLFRSLCTNIRASQPNQSRPMT